MPPEKSIGFILSTLGVIIFIFILIVNPGGIPRLFLLGLSSFLMVGGLVLIEQIHKVKSSKSKVKSLTSI